MTIIKLVVVVVAFTILFRIELFLKAFMQLLIQWVFMRHLLFSGAGIWRFLHLFIVSIGYILNVRHCNFCWLQMKTKSTVSYCGAVCRACVFYFWFPWGNHTPNMPGLLPKNNSSSRRCNDLLGRFGPNLHYIEIKDHRFSAECVGSALLLHLD
jgi:hypothetical protein